MEYFGTDLINHGHYRWKLTERLMKDRSLKFNDLPFNPECLTKGLPKGETIFYQSSKYTVIGISGSCVDERPGTKSIFWVNECISKDEMVKRITNCDTAMLIINSMKFKVDLFDDSNVITNCYLK